LKIKKRFNQRTKKSSIGTCRRMCRFRRGACRDVNTYTM
jgi:hypothetical protein